MKKIALTGILILLYSIFYAQPTSLNKLVGYVKVKNSGNKPLANVKVWAEGANPFFTTAEGYFILEFSKKSVGDVVRLQFFLEGYELPGGEMIMRQAIPKDPEALELIIAMISKKDARAEVSKNEQIISSFQDKKKIDSFQKRIAQLELAERNRKDSLARSIAKTDLDQASVIANKAYNAFDKGNVDSAISIMDDKFLDEFSQNARQQKKLANEKDKAADRAIAQSIDNYMIKARFCETAGETEAADINYAKAVKADPAIFSNAMEYLGFLHSQQLSKKGLDITTLVLQYTTYPEDRASLIHYRGIFKQRLGKSDEALADYIEAIRLYGNLRNDEIPLIYLYIGTIYDESGILDSARKYYQKGLKEYQLLQEENPDLDYSGSIADAQCVYGQLCEVEGDYQGSLFNIRASLITYDSLLKKYPSQEYYRYKVGYNSYLLSRVYSLTRQMDSSYMMLDNSLSIMSGLVKKNLHKYGIDYGNALIFKAVNLKYDYLDNKAKETYLEAENLLLKLNQENAEVLRSISLLYANIGAFYFDLLRREESERSYKLSYDYSKKLYSINRNLYAISYIKSLTNLAKVFQQSFSDSASALAYLKEAKTVSAQLKNQSLEIRAKETADLNLAFAKYYLSLRNLDSCRKYYELELETEKLLPWKNNYVFKSRVASCYRMQGLFYSDFKMKKKAIECEIKALELYQQLNKERPQEFALLEADSYQNLATFYMQLKNGDSAKYYYDLSLKLKKALSNKTSLDYTVSYARTLTNFGILYQTTDEYTEAESKCLEAEKILEPNLKQAERSLVDEEYARAEEILAGLYYDLLAEQPNSQNISKCSEAIKKAESVYKLYPEKHNIWKGQQNLNFYKGRVNKKPEAIVFAKSMDDKGDDLYKLEKDQEAVRYYHKAISFFEKAIGQSDSISFKVELSYTYYNLTLAEVDSSKKLEYINKSIALREEACKVAGNRIQEKKSLALAYVRKGDIANFDAKLLDTAFDSYKKAITIYEELMDDKSTENYTSLASIYYVLGTMSKDDYKEAVRYTQKAIDLREIVQTKKNDSVNRIQLSRCYGNNSFYLLFVRKFTEAESSAKKALMLDSTQIWVKTNLAHAYLFLDKYDEAIKLYRELKNKAWPTNSNNKLGTAVIEDFDLLEKQGINHQKIPEIRRMLN